MAVEFDRYITEYEVREVFSKIVTPADDVIAFGCYRRTGAMVRVLNLLGMAACIVLAVMFYIFFAKNGSGQNLIVSWVIIGIFAVVGICLAVKAANGESDVYYIFTDRVFAAKTKRQLLGRIFYTANLSYMRAQRGREYDTIIVRAAAQGEKRVCYVEDAGMILSLCAVKGNVRIV
ncbi:MAG: hypothetical protein IJ305_01335 [Oscillospiraceae bacterium]|nr:hypothetical protein [Oscillospiraceae bacterium]